MDHAGPPNLLPLVTTRLAQAREDPFGNPVLSAALAINRMMDEGDLTIATITALVRQLRDTAFADRARRLTEYLGGTEPNLSRAALATIAEKILRPDPLDSPIPWPSTRARTERPRYAAVFTAHPTFALSQTAYDALATLGTGDPPLLDTHRPPAAITLQQEFDRSAAAITNGRDALDQLNEALLRRAQAAWPDRWTTLTPCPVILASWVGYDTDGRTDISWADTLRLRLEMKRRQLQRLATQLASIAPAAELHARTEQACAAVADQLAACSDDLTPESVATFARTLLHHRDAALASPQPLLDLFDGAIAAASPDDQLALCIARAGLVSHGLALAHTHVRLNATQLHNAIRQRLNITDAIEDPSHRRAMLGTINAALDTVTPNPVDFGGLITEQASATRLMMLIGQIKKHVDSAAPIRFLIAETESGYTLLSALYLARLFGVENHIEISPLFETASALENGAHVLEEALRSPHYRNYLSATGRLALQFGYSDSGRYIGQTAASYLIERLRFKIAETLARFEVRNVEVILFDTHGESIGRGAHATSFAERLKYLSPTASRQALFKANLLVREESAFQGGDGYLLFATEQLALATIARIAEHTFHPAAGPIEDPIYADPDFTADFFATVRASMEALVEDRGYAAMLGAFGPALIDRTGSRPAARQMDGMASAVAVRHPRELRAIPNNAILQQIGWCANTLQGIGAAAARHPETFAEMWTNSRRFHRALELVQHALAHSDLDVLRAVIGTLDPGTWLDRAGHTRRPGRREALIAVARGLERLRLSASIEAMFRRIQADHLSLQAAWPDRPNMAEREILLHALRLGLIQRIWLLATEIPDFSPRHGVTREILDAAVLRLDISAALDILDEIFPDTSADASDLDYGEPPTPRTAGSYAREHTEIFAPIRELFGIIREIAIAITHEIGAFG